jgi:hypothetical protein
MALLRYLLLMALIVWLGSLIFFSFSVTRAAFGVLPTRHMAGSVVARTLTELHWIGIVCGIVFLLSSLALFYMTTGSAHALAPRHILIVLMLALTLASQFGISPRMHQIRTAVVEIDNVPLDDPLRVEFNRLHVWSTRLEGGVLLLGLVLAYLLAQDLRPGA